MDSLNNIVKSETLLYMDAVSAGLSDNEEETLHGFKLELDSDTDTYSDNLESAKSRFSYRTETEIKIEESLNSSTISDIPNEPIFDIINNDLTHHPCNDKVLLTVDDDAKLDLKTNSSQHNIIKKAESDMDLVQNLSQNLVIVNSTNGNELDLELNPSQNELNTDDIDIKPNIDTTQTLNFKSSISYEIINSNRRSKTDTSIPDMNVLRIPEDLDTNFSQNDPDPIKSSTATVDYKLKAIESAEVTFQIDIPPLAHTRSKTYLKAASSEFHSNKVRTYQSHDVAKVKYRSVALSTSSNPRLEHTLDLSDFDFSDDRGYSFDKQYTINEILNSYTNSSSLLLYPFSSRSLQTRRLSVGSTRLYRRSSAEITMHAKTFFEFLHYKYPEIPTTQVQDIISELLNGEKEEQQELIISNINDSHQNSITKYSTSQERPNKIWRTFYYPSKNFNLRDPPMMQSQPIIFNEFDRIRKYLNEPLSSKYPISAKGIHRAPVVCPVTTCSQNVFISELSLHFDMFHLNIPIDQIAPQSGMNFCVDVRLNRFNKNKCNLVYMVKDKITDLGISSFKNLHPILVMSSIVKITDLLTDEIDHHRLPDLSTDKVIQVSFPIYNEQPRYITSSDQFCMLIWLTGLVSSKLGLSATLTVWANSGSYPLVHKSISNNIYSIRLPQNPKSIYASGRALILTSDELRKLTNNEQHDLQIQIIVH